jgi:hypothetical protein
MRFRGIAVSWAWAFACGVALVTPGSALAGWGAPEPVAPNINQILLPPGGPGWVVGFPAGAGSG